MIELFRMGSRTQTKQATWKPGNVTVSHIHKRRWFFVLLRHCVAAAFPSTRIQVPNPEHVDIIATVGSRNLFLNEVLSHGRQPYYKWSLASFRSINMWNAGTSCQGLQICRNFKSPYHSGSRQASVNISHLPPYRSHTHIQFAIRDEEWSKRNKMHTINKYTSAHNGKRGNVNIPPPLPYKHTRQVVRYIPLGEALARFE